MNQADFDPLVRDVRKILERIQEEHADKWMAVAAKLFVEYMLVAPRGDLGAERIVLDYCADGSVEAIFFPKGPRVNARRVGSLDDTNSELATRLHAHVSELEDTGRPAGLDRIKQALAQGPPIPIIDSKPMVPEYPDES